MKILQYICPHIRINKTNSRHRGDGKRIQTFKYIKTFANGTSDEIRDKMKKNAV